MSEELLTIKVTRRQLTLIRVACLMRLDRLHKITGNPSDVGNPNGAKEAQQSYDETRAMLDDGPLRIRPPKQ